jgi:hypothetical protein
MSVQTLHNTPVPQLCVWEQIEGGAASMPDDARGVMVTLVHGLQAMSGGTGGHQWQGAYTPVEPTPP